MKEERNYCVYVHENKTNGKRYIGQTCQVPEKRWGANGRNYTKKNKEGIYTHDHFARAILKYGWDGFEHIIAYDNLSHEEADVKEQELIKLYNTQDPKYGYNSRSGGAKGLPNEETIQRLHDSHMGKMTGASHPKAKAVVCLETEEVFGSTFDADRARGLTRGTVWSCVAETIHTAGGLHYMYKDRYDQSSEEDIQAYLEKHPYYIPKKVAEEITKKRPLRKIINLDTFEIFDLVSKAAEVYTMGKTTIRTQLNYTREDYKIKQWGYVDELSQQDIDFFHNRNDEIRKAITIQNKIICLESMKVYIDAKEASTNENVPEQYVRHVANLKQGSACNKHFLFYEDYKQLSEYDREKLFNHIKEFHSYVLCKETNKVYKSYKECENLTGLDAWSISRCCKDIRRTCNHQHWQLILPDEMTEEMTLCM